MKMRFFFWKAKKNPNLRLLTETSLWLFHTETNFYCFIGFTERTQ